MTVLGYSGDRYYRHTGKVPIIGTTIAVLTTWSAAAALAVGYAYADLYCKVADLVSALIVMLFAAAGGLTVYWVMRLAKVRNLPVFILVAVTSAIILWYGSWIMWESELARMSKARLTPLQLLQDPQYVWQIAQRVNQNGTFTLNNRAVTGWELWIAWIGEAVLLLGGTIAVPILMMRGQAFCENCGAWCKRNKDVARVQHFDEELVREHMEEKDFEYLIRLGPGNKQNSPHFRVELLSCPKCAQTNLLTVNRITVGYYNGQPHENAKPVVDRLWIDPAQAEAIKSLPEKLNATAQVAEQPPPSPPIAPPPQQT